MTPTANKTTGRAKSCVVCRQFKLACDARKTAPNPCSRCVNKNLKCRFDPNFKRIATRKIAQEVTDELHTLRAAQHADLSDRSSNASHSQLTVARSGPSSQHENSRESISSHSSYEQNHSDSSRPRWLELADEEIVQDQALHGVSISSSRILKLFYHFDRYYFPHTHFLPQVQSINDFAAKSPLLFWTVLVVSAERYEGSSDGLYDQLCRVHDLLMGELPHKAIMQLQIVHALLILCLWPIPRYRNAHDPSWNYIALAISAAAALSCHSPIRKDEDFAHSKGLSDTPAAAMDPSIQAGTWISCFDTGVRLGCYLGLVPPLCVPQQTKALRQSQRLAGSLLTIPDHIANRILEILCSSQIQLDLIEDHSSHFSMTQTYESELDALRSQYQENWSWTLEVQLLSAKIYIYGMTFTLEPSSGKEQLSQTFIYRQLILEKGMQAASSFVNTMTNLSDQAIPGQRYASGILTFYPKYYFTSLMAAAAFLFRFLIAYQGAAPTQQSATISRIVEAHKIFQSFPDHRDAVRACVNIETIANVAIKHNSDPNASQTSEMVIRNRLGASVIHDAIFRAGQYRNQLRHGKDVHVSQWSEMSEYMPYIPPAPEHKIQSPPQIQPWSGTGDINMVATMMPQQQGVTAWAGIWDNYYDDFGILNEPWVQDDAEFSMAGLPQQSVYPPISGANGYGSSMEMMGGGGN